MTQQESDENLTPPVNTSNDFIFAYNQARGVVAMTVVQAQTRQQAYRAAAWLVAMGEMLPDENPASSFEEVLAAVRST